WRTGARSFSGTTSWSWSRGTSRWFYARRRGP
ncbi:MAG: hypothetical protein AVDCRST_MAG78-2104, partial [uncultured Rubrobacteraceae bacterium]